MRVGCDVPAFGEARTGRPAGGRYHRVVPEGGRRVRVRGFEEGAHDEVVSAVARADAAGALPAIREISGVGRCGPQYAGRGISVGPGGGRRGQQEGWRRFLGGSHRREHRGHCVGKLQSRNYRGIFQKAEAAYVQGAELHAVCVWIRLWRERSFLFLY